MSIGDNIKRARHKAHLTQKELGERCTPPMQPELVRKYELGLRVPKNDNICRLAKALNMTEFELMTFSSDSPSVDGMVASFKEVITDKMNEASYKDQSLFGADTHEKQTLKYRTDCASTIYNSIHKLSDDLDVILKDENTRTNEN